MSRTLSLKYSITKSKAAFCLILIIMALVLLTLTQDFLRADLNKSAFYFSESLIFSSFWWLFAPLIFAQYSFVIYKKRKELTFQLVVIIIPILLHLFLFPLLVWFLSKVFYYHTYTFQQTFRYTLSEHLYLLTLFYSIPVLFFQFYLKKANPIKNVLEIQTESIINQFISNLVVSEGNKKYNIIISEILYFSANPPYINLHLEDKKYLQNETLKSVLNKLRPTQFVRIHKSTIVNIKMVTSYTTRLNGDYDLKLKNNEVLRVSRNFARDFKILFTKTNHFTTK